jgi:hypothetical protein
LLHNKKHSTYKDIGELRLHDEFHTTRQHKFVPRQFSLPSHQDTSEKENIDQGTPTIFNTGWTIHSTSCTPSILRNTRRRQTGDSTTTKPGSNGTNPGTEIPHILLSIYFVMTIDYFHLIHKTVKKRIQHLQQHPHQAHPIDRILSQFKTTGINRQTQTTQEEEDNTNNNSTSTNNSSNTESTTNPAQPQTQRSILNERKRVERQTNPIQTKRKRIECLHDTTTHADTFNTCQQGQNISFHKTRKTTQEPGRLHQNP